MARSAARLAVAIALLGLRPRRSPRPRDPTTSRRSPSSSRRSGRSWSSAASPATGRRSRRPASGSTSEPGAIDESAATPARPSSPGDPEREPADRGDPLRFLHPDAALGRSCPTPRSTRCTDGSRWAPPGRRIERRGGGRRRAASTWPPGPRTGASSRSADPSPRGRATADWPRNPIDRFVLARLEAAGLDPTPGGRPAHADPSRDLRPHRPAAEPGGDRRLPRRRPARRLRAAGRPPARLAPLRRALGPALARPRPLRRDLGARIRLRHPDGLSLPRLRDPGLQRRPALRSLRRRAPRRRPARRAPAAPEHRDERVDPRHGLSFFLAEGTHSPVDVREDMRARVDNQIDVIGKAFLGLTIACARCHDHKFDAIPTTDYYALAGYLQSTRHQYAIIDPPERIAAPVAELQAIRSRTGAADRWPTPAFEVAGLDELRGSGAAPLRRLRRAARRLRRLVSVGRRLRDRDPTRARRRGWSRPTDVAVLEGGWAHSGAVARPLVGRPPVADVHDRVAIPACPGGRRRRADQRRHRRLREDPGPDLRRPDRRRRPRRRAPMAHDRPVDVGRPPRLRRARRRRLGQLYRRRPRPSGRATAAIAVGAIVRSEHREPPGDAAIVRGPADPSQGRRRATSRPAPPPCSTATDGSPAIPAAPDPGPGRGRRDRDRRGGPRPGQHEEPRRDGPPAVPRGPDAGAARGADRRLAAGSSWPGGSPTRSNPLTARVMVNRLWPHHLRRRDRRHPRRLRPHGGAADPSRAARLAGRRVRPLRLVDQADAPPDHDLGHLSDVEPPPPRRRDADPDERSAPPDERPAAGGRGDPRRDPGRLRRPRSDDALRAERTAPPDAVHGRPRPALAVRAARRRRPEEPLCQHPAELPAAASSSPSTTRARPRRSAGGPSRTCRRRP